MRIQIPVAAYVNYNPATYVEKALKELGHDAFITQGQVPEDDPSVDLFFCVDSGGPLVIQDSWASKCAFWFIDSRRNCDPKVRSPDDDAQAEKIFNAGGWVFQAQYEDAVRLKETGVHSYWLSLAADPDVWSDKPWTKEEEELLIAEGYTLNLKALRDQREEKIYDVAFVGNCFDPVRHQVLEMLADNFNFHWPGIEKAIMEEGAKVYRQSKVGFNISSYYGQEWDYDINMRVLEIMSCNIPLVTNHVPGLEYLGIAQQQGVYMYHNLEEIVPTIQEALRRSYAGHNRKFILDNHTYKHRMQEALGIICE